MEDYQAKYEYLVRNVLSDLESGVLEAQARAEKNAEASTAYCNELQRKLQETQKEVQESRKQLEELQQQLVKTQADLQEARDRLELYGERSNPGKDSDQPIAADSTCMSGDSHVTRSGLVDFFSGLSALSVSQCQQTSEGMVYVCEITDGALHGHTFSLTQNPSMSEFTYQPIQISPHVPSTSALADVTCFPDYMLSRFLLTLLNTTFKQADS